MEGEDPPHLRPAPPPPAMNPLSNRRLRRAVAKRHHSGPWFLWFWRYWNNKQNKKGKQGYWSTLHIYSKFKLKGPCWLWCLLFERRQIKKELTEKTEWCWQLLNSLIFVPISIRQSSISARDPHTGYLTTDIPSHKHIHHTVTLFF